MLLQVTSYKTQAYFRPSTTCVLCIHYVSILPAPHTQSYRFPHPYNMIKLTKLYAVVMVTITMLTICALVETKEDDELILGLLTPKCFNAFFAQRDFTNVECIKAVVSKALSYGIIMGSLILKLPQILKIIAAKDVTGLTSSAFYMEVVLYLSSTIYNLLRGYPLTTWGENLVILAQNIVLVLLLWAYYTPKITVSNRYGLVLVFTAMAMGMLSIPEKFQWLLASAGIPVSIVARIPQVRKNVGVAIRSSHIN